MQSISAPVTLILADNNRAWRQRLATLKYLIVTISPVFHERKIEIATELYAEYAFASIKRLIKK